MGLVGYESVEERDQKIDQFISQLPKMVDKAFGRYGSALTPSDDFAEVAHDGASGLSVGLMIRESGSLVIALACQGAKLTEKQLFCRLGGMTIADIRESVVKMAKREIEEKRSLLLSLMGCKDLEVQAIIESQNFGRSGRRKMTDYANYYVAAILVYLGLGLYMRWREEIYRPRCPHGFLAVGSTILFWPLKIAVVFLKKWTR